MKRYITVNNILTYGIIRVNSSLFRKRYRSEILATCINILHIFVANCRKLISQIRLFFSLFACYNISKYILRQKDVRDLTR